MSARSPPRAFAWSLLRAQILLCGSAVSLPLFKHARSGLVSDRCLDVCHRSSVRLRQWNLGQCHKGVVAFIFPEDA